MDFSTKIIGMGISESYGISLLTDHVWIIKKYGLSVLRVMRLIVFFRRDDN